MAVIVKYVVVRDGKDDMIFTTKKEADAYDKMLDIAERLHAFLRTAEVEIADDALDDLSFFMAQHRDQLGKLLKGGELKAPDASTTLVTSPEDKPATAATSENKSDVVAKNGRARKRKAVA